MKPKKTDNVFLKVHFDWGNQSTKGLKYDFLYCVFPLLLLVYDTCELWDPNIKEKPLKVIKLNLRRFIQSK